MSKREKAVQRQLRKDSDYIHASYQEELSHLIDCERQDAAHAIAHNDERGELRFD